MIFAKTSAGTPLLAAWIIAVYKYVERLVNISELTRSEVLKDERSERSMIFLRRSSNTLELIFALSAITSKYVPSLDKFSTVIPETRSETASTFVTNPSESIEPIISAHLSVY